MARSLLTIDDNPMIHKLLGAALKDDIYELSSVMSSEEAVDKLNGSAAYSAIISDWNMPGMSGLELLGWVKEQPSLKSIPFILLTSNTKEDYIKKGIDAGAYYYLTKPFKKDILRTIVKAAVNEYETIKRLQKAVDVAENPFLYMESGLFKIQTLEEGNKISIWIANSSPNPQETLIITELITNAIEHGNLGIGYEEKTELIDNDQLTDEIQRRLALKGNKDKYVDISYKKKGRHITVTIEDQGKGFDYNKYLTFDAERAFDNHGRGIAMANAYLNLEYLGKGNKLKITIPLDHNGNA